MNTKGAVTGGAIGAVLGGLAGFFTEHALGPDSRRAGRLKRRYKRRSEATYTAGGAVVGAALGAYFGGTATPAGALPGKGGTVPSPTGPVTPNPGQPAAAFWGSLTGAQQAAYKSDLYAWIAAGNSDPGTDTSGVTSLASLNDAGNLALATDAFQAQWNIANPNSTIGAGGAGVVDATTFNAVTGNG